MQVLILLCTLAALIGLPLGYYIGWVLEESNRLMEAYLLSLYYLPEVWR
jgi:membrane protein DedA with SNARE-associated domain